jgi:ketosteroid isomerase-like protein
VARAPEDEPVPEHRLVRQWARAVNERDRDTLVELSQRDITLHPLQVGLSGHYVGHDGLRRWIDDMEGTDIGHQVRFVSIRTLADGRVALFGTLLLGDNPISPYSLLVVLRHGKIAAMRSYLSDEEAMQHLKLLG